MVAQCRPLIEVLAEIPDPRKRRGTRHSLPAILALVCAAILCGYRSYSAISQWARVYGPDLVAALGFTHPIPPCPATLCNVLRRLDREDLEAKLGAWAEEVLASVPAEETGGDAVAIDGKTLRGSRKQGAPDVHLLSALSQRLGLTLAQHAVDDKTNEIPAVQDILRGVVIEGRIFTMDALLTQREIAHAIIDGGGDYVMIVKGNQPQLLADIQTLFAEPAAVVETLQSAQTHDQGHGRIEDRRLTASTALVGYSDWPGLAQTFELERTVITVTTGEFSDETVSGVTSLGRPRADAPRLLSLTRGQWSIENRSHWVRDMTFDEDRSQVRVGRIPQVMAALRNTAIGLLRSTGEHQIAAACRRFAAQPWSALALIGIPNN